MIQMKIKVTEAITTETKTNFLSIHNLNETLLGTVWGRAAVKRADKDGVTGQTHKSGKFIGLAVYVWRLRHVAGVPGKNGQRFTVFDSDIFTLNGQHPAFLETTQQTADGFHGQTQVVTDIATRHGQTEFTRREATLGEAAGEVVDKRGGRSSAFF